MSFYGAIVKPGKSVPYVPPPEEWGLHLSQAALPATTKEGKRVSLMVKDQSGSEYIMCTLKAGSQDSVPLDLFFHTYAEFRVVGDAEVHITGYFSPSEIEGDDEDGPPGMMDGYDSDEDEDFDSDEMEDEDEDESDEDGPPVQRHVVIEEIEDDKPAANGIKAIEAPAAKKGKQQQQQEESDEDEMDSNDEMEDDEDEDEESDEEPEPEPVKPGQKRKAEQQQANDKAKKQQQEQQAKQQALKQQQEAKKKQEQQAKQEQAKQQAQAKKEAEAKTPKQQDKAAAKVEASPAAKPSATKPNVRRWENGFEIEEVKLGPASGKVAKAGKKVEVRYVGRLKSNSKVFDQTKGKATFSFRLGVGEVIKGWDKGVEGMRVGDKRKLVIPAQMGYGSSGVRGTIPPNATLEFDVELVNVKG